MVFIPRLREMGNAFLQPSLLCPTDALAGEVSPGAFLVFGVSLFKN